MTLYSIISLPIYYYIQKPWIKTKANKKQRSQQKDPGNPYSVWVRTSKPPKSIIDGCETLPQLYDKIVNEFGDQKAFGYRPILEETEDVQANGRIFRKYVLDDYRWITYKEASKRINNIASGFVQQGSFALLQINWQFIKIIQFIITRHQTWRYSDDYFRHTS